MSVPIEADLAGYAEVRGAYDVGVDGTPWLLSERVRPQFTIQSGQRVSATAVVEAHLNEGRDETTEYLAALREGNIGDYLDNYCYYDGQPDNSEVSDYLSVERLFLELDEPKFDLKIGRQAVNWGSALVFHPTDLYNEVLVSEPWRERKGVNAAKLTVPFGPHQLTALVAADDNLGPLWDPDTLTADRLPFSAAAKLTLNAADTDFSFVGYGRPDQTWFGGVDLRGTLGVGWWIEGGFHGHKDEGTALDVSKDGAWTGGAGYPEVVAGIDYSFPVLETLYLAAEYRYDGSGAVPEDYDYQSRATTVDFPYICQADFETGDRLTLGIHYADAAARLGITRDLSVQAAVVVNLLDQTGLIVPQVGYTVGSHWALNLGAQVPFGEDGEYRPPESALQIDMSSLHADLNGLVPDAVLQAWARYSF